MRHRSPRKSVCTAGPISGRPGLVQRDPVHVGPLANDISELSQARQRAIYREWICGWRVARLAKVYGLSMTLVVQLTRDWERGALNQPTN